VDDREVQPIKGQLIKAGISQLSLDSLSVEFWHVCLGNECSSSVI